MKAQGGAFELEDGEDGDGTEDEDSQELEDSQGGVFEDDVSRSVGASSEARSQGGPEEERDHLEPKEPHDTEGDSQDTAELEESEHLQDAPPLECSIQEEGFLWQEECHAGSGARTGERTRTGIG